MVTPTSDELELTQALRGLLALQVADREERLTKTAAPRPSAVLLADAGLPYSAIAALMGKKKDAVRKSVERYRKDENG